MAAKLNPPTNFDFSNPEKWGEWKRRFDRYLSASGLQNENEETQVNCLIYTMGEEAESIFTTLNLTRENQKKYKQVSKALDEYFVPKQNPVHWRCILRKRFQQPDENVESYLRALHEIAGKCNYAAAVKPEEVRDQFVIGMRDKEVSKTLQSDPNLTLEIATQKARQEEVIKTQVSAQAQTASTANVDALRTGQQRRHNPNYNSHNKRNYSSQQQQQRSSRPPPPQRQSRPPQQHGSRTQQQHGRECGNCGKNHPPRKCYAYNKHCKHCGKLGHFAVMCRSQSRSQHEVEVENTENDMYMSSLSLGEIDKIDSNDVNDEIDSNDVSHADVIKPWYVNLKVRGNQLKFKVDSGADVNTISEDTYNRMHNRPKLEPNSQNLQSVGTRVITLGTFECTTFNGGKLYKLRIYVVKGNHANLLSRTTSYDMGILTVNVPEINDVAITKTVFGEVGIMNTTPVTIKLKDDAEPYNVGTPRTVPIPLIPKVEAEIKNMERLGVIKKISEPTDWCSPMSLVSKKNGSLRLCVDLRKLNKSIKREAYTLPTMDDILPNLSGSKYYSTLDASKGYWQIPLAEESAKLTTFITHQGRYQFQRLPFGISNASEIFQRKMSELLEGIEGVACYQDDVIVYGSTEKEHDERLDRVLKVIANSGMKLNQQKCSLKQISIKFLGHIISEHGCQPDPEKIRAIADLPSPDVDNIRSLVGMINYLGRYVPNLQTIMKPINDLLREDMQFEWGQRQIEALEEIKAKLVSAPALAYFDPKRETIVSADSSSYGLGGVLMQKHGDKMLPVAFCSRTLNDAEKGYAQIEKECLAVTWTCEKFTKYLSGLQFTLQTDHKPLIPLLSTKDIYKAPARIQRLLMRLMPYSFTPVHIPGKLLKVADGLSRSPTEGHDDPSITELTDDCEAMIKSLNWPASTAKLDAIKEASKTDPQISEAMQYTLNGWPKYITDIPANLRDLQHSQFTVADGLLLYEDRIVIPHVFRAEMLERIHDGHLGITKSRERARSCIWWPNITQEIAEYVTKCKHCQTHRPAQRKEPLIPSAPPEGPWKCIAVDLLHFENHNYLVAIDYYSKYLEISYLPKKTSAVVIDKVKALLARWGVPETIMSDNGPEFSSQEFTNFSRSYGFEHITSSPRYPQANGMAESGVKIAKSILRQEDPFLALLTYRSTSTAATGFSPAQLIMGRNLKTTLPVHPKKLEPQWPNKNDVQAKMIHHKVQTAENFNKHARELPKLNVGDYVAVKTDTEKQWDTKGVVIEDLGNRSYIIETDNGARLRRNRRHIANASRDNSSDDNSHKVSKDEQTVRKSDRMRKPTARFIERA
jgi:hypothetical protein